MIKTAARAIMALGDGVTSCPYAKEDILQMGRSGIEFNSRS